MLVHLVEGAIGELSTSSPSIFVFGASMVDGGQNAAAMPLRSRADFDPYGIDYFVKPAGRWSNGRTFMDLITEGLGYGLISPFLQSIGANFTHGVNFASSGSTASNTTASGDSSSGLFCLLVQVDQFREFQAAVMSSQHGFKAEKNMRQQFSESIYFFETGHNDYLRADVYSDGFDLNTTVLATISAMRTAFQTMYSAGARTLIVMNLTPLGCTPAILSVTTSMSMDLDENGCNAYWMEITDTHNACLNGLLEELRADYPEAEWLLFDANSLFLDGYVNPSKYGIEYPFQACCGAGGPYNYNANVDCGAEGKTINGTYVAWTKCEDPKLHLIWDITHPVESFSYYVAKGVLNGTYLTPSLSLMERVESLKSAKEERGGLAFS